MLELRLTPPPSVNALFGTNWATKKRFASKAYEAWQKEAGWQINAQQFKPWEGPYGALYLIPRRLKGDLPNYEKALTDLLVKMGVVPDDKHLAPFVMDWHAGDDAIVYIDAPEEFNVKPISHLGTVA